MTFYKRERQKMFYLNRKIQELFIAFFAISLFCDTELPLWFCECISMQWHNYADTGWISITVQATKATRCHLKLFSQVRSCRGSAACRHDKVGATNTTASVHLFSAVSSQSIVMRNNSSSNYNTTSSIAGRQDAQSPRGLCFAIFNYSQVSRYIAVLGRLLTVKSSRRWASSNEEISANSAT